MTGNAENIAIMREAFGALNRRDLDTCTLLLTEDFIINIAEMPYSKKGRAAWRNNAEILFAAFPDAHVEVEDMFAADDKVTCRVKLSGTHQGEFLGTPASGKRVEYQSHEIYRFADGKIAEEWICSDMMSLFMQIGALSKGRVISMWLSGFRFWFGLAIGALIGGLAVAMASSL